MAYQEEISPCFEPARQEPVLLCTLPDADITGNASTPAEQHHDRHFISVIMRIMIFAWRVS